MVVKVYISGISGNKEVKKRQQRVLMILDSKNIKYELIDITEPGREEDKDFMQNNSKSNGGTVSDPNPRTPLPPQVFNDEEYCGDYDQFDLANEVDTLEQFLKVEAPPEDSPFGKTANAINGDVQSKEEKQELQNNSENTVESIENTSDTKEDPIDGSNDVVKETSDKEGSAEKEESPVSQQPEDKEGTTEEQIEKPVEETEIESKQISKENTPLPEEAVNENGAVSSREQSQDKEQVNEQKIENPSEALIQSEQAASTE
ncbi:SH3 domain-binding glutamic acid-rich protein homolog [Vanessa atalanta]|uniref:SH3 domain-binding glutamic acid-rich protein homolog n=1 Tax=Vanessa atalanta TaxID=42275 RepID=UPI001FCD36CB|nr:SH3 domain-binding glutamic acid-rich protein homolog [Vanessa atalanta]